MNFTTSLEEYLFTAAFTLLLLGCSHRISSPKVASIFSQSGDVGPRSAVLWARCNRQQEGRIIFDIASTADFQDNVVSKLGPKSNMTDDYTGSLLVQGLKPNQNYYYRARCVTSVSHDDNAQAIGPVGQFSTAADNNYADSVKFFWFADIAGQGWGRNAELSIVDINDNTITGGYVIFDVMSQLQPDFAVYLGDTIYADSPIPETRKIPDDVAGGIWKNDAIKEFVAVSLEQYRSNWRYNLGDEKLRRFLLATPIYIQWDDHEVTDNWYPGEILPDGEPYYGIVVDVLVERARQALFEYSPIKGKTIYRRFQHGKHLELLLLDDRSFRGPNPENYHVDGIEMLGRQQMQWLKTSLRKSKATWKVISTDVPLSIVTGGPTDRDAWAQGDDNVLGREVQLTELLKFIKDEEIRNVLFITADMHYDSAIYYASDRATGADVDFAPFWEFVIGPANAGAFGSGALDRSFGPRYEFLRAPSSEGIGQGSPPPNLQSFGAIEVTRDGSLIVRLYDITGAVLFEKAFVPE